MAALGVVLDQQVPRGLIAEIRGLLILVVVVVLEEAVVAFTNKVVEALLITQVAGAGVVVYFPVLAVQAVMVLVAPAVLVAALTVVAAVVAYLVVAVVDGVLLEVLEAPVLALHVLVVLAGKPLH